jgi:hypothetical protein
MGRKPIVKKKVTKKKVPEIKGDSLRSQGTFSVFA